VGCGLLHGGEQLSEDSTRCTCAFLPMVVPGPEYEHHIQTMMTEGIRGRITRALAGVHHPDEPVSAIRTLSFVQVRSTAVSAQGDSAVRPAGEMCMV
jgi:hypothetical protein